MFESLIFSLNSVVPIFLIILLGYHMLNKNVIDSLTAKNLNTIVFNYALPSMLFRDIATSDISNIFDIKLISVAVFATLTLFFFSWLVAIIFIKERKSRGAFVQGSYRGNYAFIGITLIKNVMGNDYSGKAVLITAIIIPLYSILAVVVLSFYEENNENKHGLEFVRATIVNIFKNPLIRGVLLGVVFCMFGIKIPVMLEKSIGYLSQMATPLALISIGSGLSVSALKSRINPTILATIIKLALSPIIFATIAYLVGMRNEDLLIIFIAQGSPTAVTSYIMVVNMKNDGPLASNIVLLTTFFSIFTLTIGIFFLKYFGLLN